MSKNISIKEGGVSRYFSASKLRTNLQGGSTCDWVPIDEVDDYVELEELNVTENGIYYPTEKVGISKVSVDVPQQGSSVVPSGVSVRATAAEDLTAGDCVYIISGGTGGIAPVTPSIFSGVAHYHVASDGTYVYYYDTTSEIKRIPLNDLNGTPEVYKSGISVSNCTRNLISYTENSVSVVKNVKTNVVNNASIYSKGFSQNYAPFNSPTFGMYGINDLTIVLSSNVITRVHMINPTDYVSIQAGSYPRSSYIHNINNVDHTINVDTPFYINDLLAWNVINKKLIVFDANLNVIYYDLNSDDGIAHALKDRNGNAIKASAKTGKFKYNAEGNMLFIQLGTYGLAVVHEDLSVAVYTNITGISEASEMFGNYYYDYVLQQIYFIPQEATMGKTNAKSHEGSLGYVASDVAAGNVGVATEMFR